MQLLEEHLAKMPVDQTGIKVEGIQELVKGFNKMDKDVKSAVKDVHQRIGNQVVNRVRPKLMSEAKSPTGKLAQSLRSARLQTSLKIRLGRTKTTPYAGPFEYGGKVNGKEYKQYRPEGYTLWPYIEKDLPNIRRKYLKALLNNVAGGVAKMKVIRLDKK